MVQSTATTVTINWTEVTNAQYFILKDESGKQIYKGKDSKFTISNLSQDGYSSYYLTGHDRQGKPVTERVAVTAKTKVASGEEKGFTSMILTKKGVTLDWESIENLKSKYKIVRDGQVLAETTDTIFKDSSINTTKIGLTKGWCQKSDGTTYNSKRR